MKRKIYTFFIAVAVLFGNPSCGDFLEENSQTLSYVYSTSDLLEILAGSGYMPTRGFSAFDRSLLWLNTMDDDIRITIVKAPDTYYAGKTLNFHNWQAYPYSESDKQNVNTDFGGNSTWLNLYKYIGVANIVIAEAERFKESEPEGYRKARGEALFLRAQYYFYLTNIYGHPYNVNTASTDLGVPLKITEYIEETEGFSRNTVAQCYNQIVEDLKESITLLEGVTQKSIMRTSDNAARLLLSRVYLFMNQWQNAYDLASNVIENPKGKYLYNLNTTGLTYATYQKDAAALTYSEAIFVNGVESAAIMQANNIRYTVSEDLYGKYVTDDLRKTIYFKVVTNQGVQNQHGMSASTQISNPSLLFCEAYLIKAETAAMLDDKPNAISAIKDFRTTRIKTGKDMSDDEYNALSDQSLVDLIRDERRKELCYRGYRWFDLRRYAVSSKYPLKTTLTHYAYEWNGTAQVQVGYYELGTYPEDGGWLMPIPNYALESNKGMLIDNPRPERLMKN